MGKIHTVRISPCDDSTYWQTGKLLFFERCIANGNCIGKFSACGGSNGHFAFDGDSGRGLFLSTHNAAAADGCAAGNCFLFTIRIHSFASCAALCGDLGGTGFGALDGDIVSGILGVGFCFCAAADTGCTHTALGIVDRCVAINGHIAIAAIASADTGTFVAALCIVDRYFAIRCVAINGHIAKAARAAADAGCTNTALGIGDRCVAINGHIAIAARTAADAGATAAALGIGDRCIAFDGHFAKAARAAADAGTIGAAGRALDGGGSFNPHSRAAIDTAADACAAIAALRIFDRCVILDGYLAGTHPTAAANTGRLFAASSLFDRCIAGNCHIAFTGATAADAGTSAAAARFFNNSAASNRHSYITARTTARTTAADACAAAFTRLRPRNCSANGIDRSAGNGNVGTTARTAATDTSAIGAARRGNAATGNLDFTGVLHISAANARTAETARGS